MRLICPNCEVQYEVEETLIPSVGREVQCSNCSYAWFQKPARDAPHHAGAGDADPELAPRSPLGDTEAQVLREEADREAKARRVEADAPPPQAERLAWLRRGDPDAPEARPETGDRDLLPGSEEVHAGLRAPADSPRRAPYRREMEMQDLEGDSSGGGGFVAGLTLTILLAAIAMAIYALAPELADTFPGAADELASYADTLDAMRVALDATYDATAQAVARIVEDVLA